ncbi:MAG: HEPN domain-containing protein [SAR324 cluster bacterium]|nr:HEPN domain-containing protein [SAR324 cluster bacterium]
MLKTNESSRSIKRAQVSWQQSEIDLKIAKSSLAKQPDKSSMQSAQAAMNALSSILEAQGYFQLPAFSTVELLKKCIEIEPSLEELRADCTLLDGTVERDSFGTTRTPHNHFTPAFAKACLKACDRIIKRTKKYWKQNKRQYFNP